MDPISFRNRFKANVASNPRFAQHSDLRRELSEFVSFDAQTLRRRQLHTDDVKFLLEGGLPKEAGPFLTFSAYTDTELKELYTLYDMPETLFPFGTTGAGDSMGIELESRAVVYFNHDSRMRRVFVNSSIGHLAQALCLYQEARLTGDLSSLLNEIALIDAPAAASDAMWSQEVQAELGQ